MSHKFSFLIVTCCSSRTLSLLAQRCNSTHLLSNHNVYDKLSLMVNTASHKRNSLPHIFTYLKEHITRNICKQIMNCQTGFLTPVVPKRNIWKCNATTTIVENTKRKKWIHLQSCSAGDIACVILQWELQHFELVK